MPAAHPRLPRTAPPPVVVHIARSRRDGHLRALDDTNGHPMADFFGVTDDPDEAAALARLFRWLVVR